MGQVAGTHHGQQISLVDGHLLLMHTHALLNAVQIPRDGGPLYGNGAVRLALSTGASPVFDQTEQLIMFDNNVKQHTEVLKWHKHIWPY